MKEILLNSICHWASAMDFSEQDYFSKIQFIENLYEKNKVLILTHRRFIN